MTDNDEVAIRGRGETIADELISNAVHITPENIRHCLRGIPLKARLALGAITQLPFGSLILRLPDKRVMKIGGNNPGPDAVVILHNWNLPKRAISASTVGIGESYMDGDWESPDVTTFLELFVANEDLGYKIAEASPIVRAVHSFRHWLNRNTKTRAARNISAHYDLGNEFYSHWLDPSMTYSSGLFSEGAHDLESAQAAKYRALAEATGIRPEDHVLEIGCGWGGFAEFAAREIGCRVTGLTLSREQLRFANERVYAAGLSDKVRLKYQDYRDETATYDKVVSIEMFEAVGEKYWPKYFSKVSSVLAPGGRAGLQIITINEKAFPDYRASPDFIQRYIFPGGMLPTPQALHRLTSENGLAQIGERIMAQDYARTLKLWRERFWEAWDTISAQGFDERFRRMWEFYLHYCEAGFRDEFIDVRQLVYART
ncbi:SAM-dependent methyltransferase [Oricola cellulosilytica]|uniref:Class I SAM-dependent methyltransferase n=1 Tax=Oricola cellulosilytica TaxID=1429082 RepID=A0A4R0P9B4_9HYPH|nr:cyclopropane-fatty-acyl-phospholipid synthase family protein [Oricola cellulosilytica]TCD12332.1 class I SAM-dependent methyltransferase [Oricola cellulosilytica]